MDIRNYIILVLTVLLFGVFIYIFTPHESKISVSDDERWGDLNNVVVRNRFCQAEGFDSGKIQSTWMKDGYAIMDRAGNPYGYDVYCVRMVEEHQAYSYDTYKRWMINLEINNSVGDII